MYPSIKKRNISKRRETVLFSLTATFFLLFVSFFILWLKERLKNCNNRTQPAPILPNTTYKIELLQINKENLNKDFWGTLYDEVNTLLLLRTYPKEEELIEDLLKPQNYHTSDVLKEKAKKFTKISGQLTLIRKNSIYTNNDNDVLDLFIRLLKTANNLLCGITRYFKNNEESRKNVAEVFIDHHEQNEFEIMYQLLLQISIYEFQYAKRFVFNLLNSKNIIESVKLNSKQTEIYTKIAKLYKRKVDDLANVYDLLTVYFSLDSPMVIPYREMEIQKIQLNVAFNALFMVFWEIRIDEHGELGEYQKLLESKFNDEQVRNSIKEVFSKIIEFDGNSTNTIAPFINQVVELVKIIIQQYEKWVPK